MDERPIITTPVIRDLRTLFADPLPKEPLIIHMTADEWSKLSDGLRSSRRKIGPEAKGLFVIPDPFGGYLGFLACAVGSSEGVACLPQIVNTGGAITFGRGCTCIRGEDPVDPPDPEVESCAVGFTLTGRLTCVGTCRTGRECRLVHKTSGAGHMFVTCECA